MNTLLLGYLAVALSPLFLHSLKQLASFAELKTRIGVITIQGPIKEASQTVHEIKHYFEDPSIKAIVLKIDSPGGIAGTAQSIFNEVRYYKAKYPKFVVAHIEKIAASGGYYVACAADHIIASPGAIVGSVGAVFEHYQLKQLLDRLTIKYDVTKSGEYKTAGNPFIDMQPHEKAEFQALSDDVYRQFMRDVMECRKQLPEDTKLWAEGRVFTGEQALALKMIDQVGSPAQVIEALEKNVHIVGRIEWVKSRKPAGRLELIFGEDNNFLSTCVNNVCQTLEDRYGLKASC